MTVQLRILSDSIGKEKTKKNEAKMITIVSQAQENVLMLARRELTAVILFVFVLVVFLFLLLSFFNF